MKRRTVNGRRISALALPALALTLLLGGCAGYGGETSRESDGFLAVESAGEYCEVILPDGWTWYPARWSARSPGGTEMQFEDYLFGRPEYADWEEVLATKLTQTRERSPDAAIEETPNSLLIDYGENGGLAYLQRFDRVGCQVTFTNARETRATEYGTWQQIIASFRRVSPDPTFTPPAAP